MRPIALIALLMLSSGAWAIADTLTGQSDATEYVTLPEGNGSLYLSGDTDETCSLEMLDGSSSPSPVALAEYDDTAVAAGVSVRLDFGAGQKVRVSCTDTTEATVSVEIWPLRIMRNGQWFYRFSKDYNDVHCPDGCVLP
jgi:hypothetical protein